LWSALSHNLQLNIRKEKAENKKGGLLAAAWNRYEKKLA
jgi:hypothetical protein